MLAHVIALLVGITVQTAFLLLAFWIMIKLQGLNYNFLGLLGVAALVGGLDQILDTILGHFLGFYLASSISSPIILVAAFIGIKKLTEADKTDVMFTVAVGYALCFAMNMWLIGALLGDLRLPAKDSSFTESDQTLPSVEETNAAPPPPVVKAAATNILKGLTIKGATQNGNKSSVTLFVDGKIYTIYSGDTTLVPMDGKLAPVKLEKVEAHSLTLNVNGISSVCPY